MSVNKGLTRIDDAIIPDELVRLSQIGGGGAGLTVARVVKKTDETITSDTTLQDDDELKFTPEINKQYFGMIITWIDAVDNGGMKHAFSIPTGATIEWMASGALWRAYSQLQNEADGTIAIGTSNVPGKKNAATYFKLKMGSTAGDVIYQWAQNTSNATSTTIEAGSLLLIWEEV